MNSWWVNEQKTTCQRVPMTPPEMYMKIFRQKKIIIMMAMLH